MTAARQEQQGLYKEIKFTQFLKEHVVVGVPTMPGTMALELARVAGEHCYGKPLGRMRQVIFSRPLTLTSISPVRTRIQVDEDGHFHILSSRPRSDGRDRWVQNVEMTLDPGDNGSAPIIDLFSISARCPEMMDVAKVYGWFRQVGIKYGPMFHTLQQVRCGKREVLAELNLDRVSEPDAAAYCLHPCLLDGALQAIACLAIGSGASTDNVYLPYLIEEVLIWGNVNGPVSCYVRVETNQADPDSSQAQIAITDRFGQVLVQLNGVQFRRVPLPSPQIKPVFADWLYRRIWRQTAAPTLTREVPIGPWLILRDALSDGGLSERLTEILHAKDARVVVIDPAEQFVKRTPMSYAIRPDREEDYDTLFDNLQGEGILPTHVIHTWNMCTTPASTVAAVESRVDRGVLGLFHLCRAAALRREMSSIRMDIVSADSHTVNQESCLNPENGAAWGLMRVVDLECPSFRIQCVDVQLPIEDPPAVAEQILSECCDPHLTPEVVYRNGKRWVPHFGPFDHTQTDHRDLAVQEGATYLITGGTGGLGLEVARWLASNQRVNLALIGRRPLQERQPDDDRSRRVLEAVEQFRAGGNRVLHLSADVADPDTLASTLVRVRQELGPIRGVFHAAGVNQDKFLRAKDEASFRQVLRPKIQGTWHLDQLTRNDPLDFMVLFSSIVSLTGNVGQCDYAAANRYLDCFAAWREAQGRPTLSINWGPWAEIGMAVKVAEASRTAGIEPLPTAGAIAALEALMRTREPCVAVVSMSDIARERLGRLFVPDTKPEKIGSTTSPEAAEVPAIGVDPADVEDLLLSELATFLEIDPEYLDPEANFADLGVDSIMASELLNQLQEQHRLELSPTLLFEATNVATLAEVLAAQLNPEHLNAWRHHRGYPVRPIIEDKKGIELPNENMAEIPPRGEKAVLTHPEQDSKLDSIAPDLPLQPHGVDPKEVVSLLIEETAAFLEIDSEHIDPEARFEEYGLDPVTASEMLRQIEAKHPIKVSPNLVFIAPNIVSMAQTIANKLTPKVLEQWRENGHSESGLPTRVKSTELLPPKGAATEPASALETAVMTTRSDFRDRPIQSPLPTLSPAETGNIAVVGYACRFPGADNAEQFWENLRGGVNSITRIPAERQALHNATGSDMGAILPGYGGFLKGMDRFDTQFFGITDAEAEQMDPQHRLFLEVSWEALEAAGYAGKAIEGTRTGVFVGLSFSQYAHEFTGRLNEISSAFGLGNTTSILANRISYMFDLKGPSLTVETACSSSLVATHLGCQSVLTGESTMALVGGVNIFLLPEILVAFHKAGILCSDGSPRPLDDRANGYVRGEGVAAMLIKTLDAALQDGDQIHAVIKGTAVNQDGRTNGLIAPNPASQMEVIQEAHRRAGIDPATVSYVEVQGVASTIGDAIEMRALTEAFNSNGKIPIQSCAVGSVKPNIGHLEIASGMSGLIKVILAAKHRQLPATLGLKAPNRLIKFEETPFYVNDRLQVWTSATGVLRAGVSCFGFGGTNAHIVLEEPPSQSPETSPRERPLHLLCLSGNSSAALQKLAASYADLLCSPTPFSLADVCYTAATGRRHMSHRIAVVSASASEMAEHLREVTSDKPTPAILTGHVSAKRRLRIGFLFSGQGSQFPDMGRELYENQPTFHRTLNLAEEILRSEMEQPLLQVLYGSESDTALLKETRYTQPALFALEYALAELWRKFGIAPTVVLGHSIGEYVAACVSGVFDFETGLKLVAERARLLQSLPSDGSMVAALCPESHVREAIRPFEDRVSIAAVNGPQQTVLSGYSDAVGRIVAALNEFGIVCRPLNVSHAFHSVLVEPILDAFADVLAKIDFSPPEIPIVSNVTGKVLSVERAISPDYWVKHLRQGVRFADGLESMAAMGCNIFLEVGPQPTLIGMGRRILTGRDNIWLESLQRGRSDWTTLLISLGKLYCRGQDVDWKRYDQDYARSHVSLPTYPFDRRRFWVKHPRTFVASASEESETDVPTVSSERLSNQTTAIEAYENYARPLVSRLLHVGYLDKCYHRASGNRMWYMADGREIEVVDLVGGYGSVVFGHNHPELVDHACKILNDKKPVHAQASIRGEAALLCREISEQLCAYTGHQYVTTLVNSGTEAIEAAIKHAEIEYQVLANAELQKADRAFALLAHQYRDEPWKPPAELLGKLREIIGGETLEDPDLNRIHQALVAHNESILNGPPTFLALDKAFHGRTSGATSLTANPDFITSYGRSGLLVVRIKPGDVNALEEAVQANRYQLWHLREASTGLPILVSHTWFRIAALFVEPVQGEGGVRLLPDSFIDAVNKLTDNAPFPIIVDEIQSGLGRCGAFTASEIMGLRGNYFAFAKSLGGGLAKTAALCVERRRYQNQFGLGHTSTFAEDDFSSGIARQALQIFQRDDIGGRCAAIGKRFLHRLRKLQAQYPSVIEDVRGLGCMIGLEISDTAASPSLVLRVCSQLTGLVASAYLINEERIRVLPTTSAPRTLRIEPSAYFTDADMDRCIEAFDRLCRIIENANAGRLLLHMVSPNKKGPEEIQDWRSEQPVTLTTDLSDSTSVAFVFYYVQADDFAQGDPSLRELPEGSNEEIIRLLAYDSAPAVVSSHCIRSSTGEMVNLHLIGLMLTSRIIEEAWRSGDSGWIRNHLEQSVDLACELGCQTIGFAGFLSIASYNCKRLATTRIGLTTGNALTVGIGIESIQRHSKRMGIDLESSCLGAIGAAGNICSTYVRIMAEKIGRLVLVGRPGSLAGLETTAAVIYEDAWEKLNVRSGQKLSGVAGRISSTQAVQNLRQRLPIKEPIGVWLHRTLDEELGSQAPIQLSEDLSSMINCNLIITASNTADAILYDQHLGEGPIVICDIAVPPDVNPSIRENRPDVVVTNGGCVRMPGNQDLKLTGIYLPDGHVYACTAETIVLGLAQRKGHYSFGPLDPTEVYEILNLAKDHGFVLGDDVAQSGAQAMKAS